MLCRAYVFAEPGSFNGALFRARRLVAVFVITAALLPGMAGAQEPTAPAKIGWVDDAALAAAASRNDSWLTHGRTYSEQRFSPLDQIDAENVGELGLVWAYRTGIARGHEATPLVAEGMLFATGPWSVVFALDVRSGEELWRWDPEVDRGYARLACCDVVNRGVALYEGRVYVGALDGRLVALDAATGKPLWQVQTVDPERPYTITGAPRVVEGKVIIGNGGAEYGVRGYVSAYDAASGDLVWRTHTVPGDPSLPFESEAMRRAADTWSGGKWWEVGGGGTVWDSMAYDPELELLYVGTGNGSPWNRHVRSPGGGDNLYLSSILALRPGDGSLVWHYQTTPGDTWDYTATQHIILADLEIGGRQRKVAMQAPKNGFFYVLDRETGELLSAEAYIPLTWAERVDLETGRPIEVEGADYKDEAEVILPSALGGHNWQPMSYSPETGLVYLPAQERAAAYAGNADYTYRPGTWNTGTTRAPAEVSQRAADRRVQAYLLAWDPKLGRERWRVPQDGYWNGGLLSTAGDLVFQGRSDGFFLAYRASDGKELWKSWAATGIIAAPITYEVDGVQHVTIVAGWGGAYGLARPDPAQSGLETPAQILTFALGGGAAGIERRAGAARAPSTSRLAAIPNSATEAQIAAGAELYRIWCEVCHGADAIGGGIVPDLRLSGSRTFDGYHQVLLEGALQENGMPSFTGKIDEAGVHALKGYIVERRGELIAGN